MTYSAFSAEEQGFNSSGKRDEPGNRTGQDNMHLVHTSCHLWRGYQLMFQLLCAPTLQSTQIVVLQYNSCCTTTMQFGAKSLVNQDRHWPALT